MKKVFVLVCLITLFASSCSDDEPELKNSEWEYADSNGNFKYIHSVTFDEHIFYYTIYTEPVNASPGSEKRVFEFEGKYVYRHPDVKLELHGARTEFTCSENKMISKGKEATIMVFIRK